MNRRTEGPLGAMDEGSPLFLQIARRIENAVVDGSLAEDAQAPSANELAAFHRINPATAAKGINQLVGDGILYKKRGIGMFVAPGAQERLRERRRRQFTQQYVEPLLAEAAKLALGIDEVTAIIEREGKHHEGQP
jgi:GntR family transcriptional regulator